MFEKPADIHFCNIPQYTCGYCCQRSAFFVTNAVKWSSFLWCRKGKALCERPFALHCQQPEKDKQNVEFSPPENVLRMPME